MKMFLGSVLAMVSTIGGLGLSHFNASEQQTITISKLQAYYSKEHAKFLGMTLEGSNQALVSYRYPGAGMPVDYDWWNLRTWTTYVLPTSPAFVDLLQVISPTEVKFLATGENAIDGFVAFPYIIDCVRGDSKSQFEPHVVRDYVGIQTSESFGDGKKAAVVDMRSTMDGLQVAFGPVRGYAGDFISGSTGIPMTKTSYDSRRNEFILHFSNAKVYWQGKVRPNHYFDSATVKQVGAASEVTLHLTKDANYYNVDQLWVLDSSQEPYLSLAFIEDSPDEPQVQSQSQNWSD